MTNRQLAKAVLLSVIFSLLANVFFGRYLSAKLSTMPLLNRLKLLSPQAPIVITQREEVRISGSGDFVETVNTVRSKISAVLAEESGVVRVVGSAFNLASDGYFVTVKGAVPAGKQEKLSIKLDDGTVVSVAEIFYDTATNLAVVRAAGNGVPTAVIAESEPVLSGQRAIFVSAGLADRSPNFQSTYVMAQQNSSWQGVLNADIPSRTFLVQGVGQLQAGEVLVSPTGEILGIWDGKKLISGDVLRDFAGKFLSSKGQVARPQWGFSYRIVSSAESKLAGRPYGAFVAAVNPGSPAAKAGLLEGDVIVAVDGSSVEEKTPLEEILQNYKPGDVAKLKVWRSQQAKELAVTAGTLK